MGAGSSRFLVPKSVGVDVLPFPVVDLVLDGEEADDNGTRSEDPDPYSILFL